MDDRGARGEAGGEKKSRECGLMVANIVDGMIGRCRDVLIESGERALLRMFAEKDVPDARRVQRVDVVERGEGDGCSGLASGTRGDFLACSGISLFAE